MAVSPDHLLPEKPFQFGMRALFVSIALLGAVLAIMVHLAPIWSMAFGWMLLLVLAHVAGNVWGTRSRAQMPPASAPDAQSSTVAREVLEFVPSTRLRDSSRLTRSMLVTALIGSTLGAILGTSTIIYLYHDRVSYLGTSIASISGAMLGALLGFLASSFLGIAGRAFREAADDASPSRAQR
jgi:Mg/Co/Ni transporter MgtE